MKTLDIEVVDIRKVAGDSNLKAFADLKLGSCAVVKGFSVVSGKNGLFVAMPKKQGKEGKWFEIFTPLADDMRHAIEDLVMEAYERETDGVKD